MEDLSAQVAKNTRELEALKAKQIIGSQTVVPTYAYSATRRYNTAGVGLRYRPKVTFTTSSGNAGIVSFTVNIVESNAINTPNILPGFRVEESQDNLATWFVYGVTSVSADEYITIEVRVVSNEPGTLSLGEY